MFSLSFSPDGARLATSGADKTVYVWDTRTWTIQQRLTGDPETVSSMTFSGDGNLLAAGGADPTSNRLPSTITIWDVRSGKKIRVVPTAHLVTSVAFAPDGRILAAADGDKTVMLRALRERVD